MFPYESAVEARKIINKFGIGINDASNGVFLPIVEGVSNANYHPSLHTHEYYDKVYDMLSSATTREEALSILNEIGTRLSTGTFF